MSRKMSLLVRNLRYETTADAVRGYFERFGEIRDVYLTRDFQTKRPRGFCFVEFYDDRDAQNALHETHKDFLDGNQISVTIAQQGRKSPESMRVRERREEEYSRSRRYREHSRRRSRSHSRSHHRDGGYSDRRVADRHHRRDGRAGGKGRSYSRSPSFRRRRPREKNRHRSGSSRSSRNGDTDSSRARSSKHRRRSEPGGDVEVVREPVPDANPTDPEVSIAREDTPQASEDPPLAAQTLPEDQVKDTTGTGTDFATAVEAP